MRKVHESLTPLPPLLHFSLSHLFSPVHWCVCPSRSVFSVPFSFSVFSLSTRYLHFPPTLSYSISLSFSLIGSSCSGRSASLSRLLFNPSTLCSIAILLYLLLAQSPCFLVDRVCYPPSKKSLLPLRPSYLELEIRVTITRRKLAAEIANFSRNRYTFKFLPTSVVD